MVLYTILSNEEIFPSEETKYELITYGGRKCVVAKRKDGTLQMIQLLSTDPNDFLLQQFHPGNCIHQKQYE